jgi:hypothetical protein
MSYSIEGIAYNTRNDAMTALIANWVSAGGDNDIEEAKVALDNSDTACDIIKNWGGDLGCDYATEGDLLEHMANYRAEILERAYGES